MDAAHWQTSFEQVAREGAALVATFINKAVTIPVMIAFAAITIDVGMLFNTRADLQNAADAASLAAAGAA